MSIEDILTLPDTFTVEGKEYKAEFDCKGLGVLESLTGKSLYNISGAISSSNLFFTDWVELTCTSLLKHHTEKEVQEVRAYLEKHILEVPSLSQASIAAFLKVMAPPEEFEKVAKNNKEDDTKKKIETEV